MKSLVTSMWGERGVMIRCIDENRLYYPEVLGERVKCFTPSKYDTMKGEINYNNS